jgi:proline iminopeptidase
MRESLRGVLAALVATVGMLPLIASVSRPPPSACVGQSDGARAHAMKTGGARRVPLDDAKKNYLWTRRLGSGPVKLLLLPGGPSCSHEYFEVFEDFVPQHGVELIYYDPLDTGGSSHPGDPSLWTMDGLVEQVEAVRVRLALDDLYVLGHSAGGWVAMEYALAHPEHVRGLVLSNTNASVRSWLAYTDRVVAAEAPPEVSAQLADCKRRGDGDGYRELSMPYMMKRRFDPDPPIETMWPAPVFAACFGAASSQPLGDATLGVPAFEMKGTLSAWDRWADLPKIRVPTLVLGTRHDIQAPEDTERMAALIPGAKLAMLERGSHFAMYDNQDAYFDAVIAFLDGVEAQARRAGRR